MIKTEREGSSITSNIESVFPLKKAFNLYETVEMMPESDLKAKIQEILSTRNPV